MDGILTMRGVARPVQMQAVIWRQKGHEAGDLSHLTVRLTGAVLRLVWHRISPPPLPIGPVAAWQTRVARGVHGLIYLCLLAIPLTGWIASSATGIDVMILDRWAVPAVAPVSEAWEDGFFAAHGVLTKALIGLLALHIGGALLRGIKQDGTMERMIGG